MKSGKHVILYIDDDPDYLEAVRTILEANDYVMLEAASAEEGLMVYKEERPDLVIVDLMMEEIDSGTNFVREVERLGNRAPVYMLSSTGDHLNQTTDFSTLGLTGVFQKPINTDMLLAILRAKLG